MALLPFSIFKQNGQEFEVVDKTARNDIIQLTNNLIIKEHKNINISNNLAPLGKKAGYKPIYVGTTDNLSTVGTYNVFTVGHSGDGNYFVKIESPDGTVVTNPNYAVTIVWLKVN